MSGASNTTASDGSPSGIGASRWHDHHQPSVRPASRLGDDPDGRLVHRLGDDEDRELGQVAQAEVDVRGVEGGTTVRSGRVVHIGRAGLVVRIVDLTQVVGFRRLERRDPRPVAHERDVTDPAPREVQDDRIGRRVVPDPADELDRTPGTVRLRGPPALLSRPRRWPRRPAGRSDTR